MVFDSHTDHTRILAPLDNQIQNQPTSTSDSLSDETMADVDEPPDPLSPTMFGFKPRPRQAQDFSKKSCALERKESLLTQMIHTSESDSNHEDENLFSDSRRAHSSASTWSRGSGASTADLTSDGHTSPTRTGTPSPTLPPARFNFAPIFNQKPFDGPPTIKSPPSEVTSPLQKPQISSNEQSVEAGLGRKRCITFACGRKEEVKNGEPAKVDPPKPAEPAKRPCALKFVCPTRDSAVPAKPHARFASPPPARKLPPPPRPLTRPHRGSDSTVRNDSPKAVRKVPSVMRTRKTSEEPEVDRNEATRFHEFASSEEEVDDWTQEVTCHKSRLTVNDTLRVENDLRKLGTEAEEEAMDEEEELDDEVADYDEEEEDDDENMSVGPISSAGYVSDEGFHSDDEEGFAGSDEENEADSDDEWWAPGRGRQLSAEPLEHIRPTSRRSNTDSSIASVENGQTVPTPIARISSRRPKNKSSGKSSAPELPDSTDFVCGTLDEDRPVEEAYLNALRQRQAQKHKTVPQDFDPTFPTSDPDMDEEDEESERDIISDSDGHMFIHGHMDPHEDAMDLRGEIGTIIPRKRSPPSHSPQPRTRLRSPPPTKRAVYRSPPPPTKRVVHRSPPPPTTRRGLLFSQSPQRHCSPPPHYAGPLRSPPPTRRPSFNKKMDIPVAPVGLASRPQRGRVASSLPRDGHDYLRKPLHSLSGDEDDADADEQQDALPTRGAIDIVKGLEKKRQRRREKLFEKHCRLREQGKVKHREGWKCPRGKGAERMREVGLECAALRGKRHMVWKDEGEGATHILSY